MIVESTNVQNTHQSPAFAKPLLGEDVGLSKRFISFSGNYIRVRPKLDKIIRYV